MNDTITLNICCGQFIVKSKQHGLLCKIDACMVYDLLKNKMRVNSKHVGEKRRALQLSGLSLEEVLVMLSNNSKKKK